MSENAIKAVEAQTINVIMTPDGIEPEPTLKIESAGEANRIHRLILNSLQAAAAVGEFLSRKKSELGHGNWIPWVQENLDFSDRTASNYIRVFKNADFLNRKGISDSTEAYRLLINRTKAESNRETKRKEHEDRIRQFESANLESKRLLAQQPVEPKVQEERIVQPEPEPDYPEILREIERSVFEVVDTYMHEGSHTIEERYKLWGLAADQLADLSERFRCGSKADGEDQDPVNTPVVQPPIVYNPDDDPEKVSNERRTKVFHQVDKEFEKFIAQLKKTVQPRDYWLALHLLCKKGNDLKSARFFLNELKAFMAARGKHKCGQEKNDRKKGGASPPKRKISKAAQAMEDKLNGTINSAVFGKS